MLPRYLLGYNGGCRTIRHLVKKKMGKFNSLWCGGCCRIPYLNLKYKANSTALYRKLSDKREEIEGKGMLLHIRTAPSESWAHVQIKIIYEMRLQETD